MSRTVIRPIFAASTVFLISFGVYLSTMAPGVPFIDGGELAAACATLGICHPTGYPLFTMIGYLFAHLPIASTVILRLNTMSAFFTALGSGAMVFLGYELTKYWLRFVKLPASKQKKSTAEPASVENSEEISVAAGVFAGVTAAFSQTWWAQSNSIEVYPIHCLMMPLVLLFFFRMLRLEKRLFGKNSILFALFLGLSFSNHLTTILLGPACLFFYFAICGINQYSLKKLLKLAVPFIVGLLPYLYFPIRASSYPLMDWGHPADLKLFMKHFSGGQYKVWMFTSGAPAKNWPYFWHEFPTEFSYIGILLIFGGLFASIINSHTKRWHITAFVGLLFFGCLLYSINFDILEIDPYFLTAYLACAVLMMFGIVWLSNTISSKVSVGKVPILLTASLIIALLEIGTNYSSVDESGNHFVDDATMNVLNNLPPNAIIFSSAWDFWLSGAFYYQLVEHIRPDILVVDVAMLRDRPWYYSYLKQRAPEVMAKVQQELDAFLVHLNHFDRDEPFDPSAIGESYKQFTEALVRKNQDRPIFISSEVFQGRDPLFAPSFHPLSAGIEYRLVEHDTIFDVPIAKIQWNDAKYKTRSYYTDGSRLLQAGAFASMAESVARQGKLSEARQWIDLALKFKPDMSVDPETLQERDKQYAYRTNEEFVKMEQFKAALQ